MVLMAMGFLVIVFASKIWDAIKGPVSARVYEVAVVIAGGKVNSAPVQKPSGGNEGKIPDVGSGTQPIPEGGVATGETENPDEEKELSLEEKEKIAHLKSLANHLNGLANFYSLFGDEEKALALDLSVDAINLEIAAIKGKKYLEVEIASIAATHTVEYMAELLLKCIEKRIPIARIVTCPIVDGLGQLTGDFIHWWYGYQ
jgi:hypothetical protein